MSKKIFINLPVKDLDRSVTFFTKLGFTFNAQFTDEKATCMIISDHIFAMLLVEPFFKTFTKKEISDTGKFIECINSISLESKAEVDEMIQKAVEAGANIPGELKDHGFMYQHGFEDPDGHLWEVFWMDPSAVQG